jgi:hypothetical protein
MLCLKHDGVRYSGPLERESEYKLESAGNGFHRIYYKIIRMVQIHQRRLRRHKVAFSLRNVPRNTTLNSGYPRAFKPICNSTKDDKNSDRWDFQNSTFRQPIQVSISYGFLLQTKQNISRE